MRSSPHIGSSTTPFGEAASCGGSAPVHARRAPHRRPAAQPAPVTRRTSASRSRALRRHPWTASSSSTITRSAPWATRFVQRTRPAAGHERRRPPLAGLTRQAGPLRPASCLQAVPPPLIPPVLGCTEAPLDELGAWVRGDVNYGPGPQTDSSLTTSATSRQAPSSPRPWSACARSRPRGFAPLQLEHGRGSEPTPAAHGAPARDSSTTKAEPGTTRWSQATSMDREGQGGQDRRNGVGGSRS